MQTRLLNRNQRESDKFYPSHCRSVRSDERYVSLKLVLRSRNTLQMGPEGLSNINRFLSQGSWTVEGAGK